MVLNKQQQRRQTFLVEYPLKVVEIAEFFLNFDSLVWQKLTRDFSNQKPTTISNTNKPSCYNIFCGEGQIHEETGSSLVEDESSRNDDSDTLVIDKHSSRPVNSSQSTTAATAKSNNRAPCLNLEYSGFNPSLTLLFIDSDLLRQNFEKSHLKLVNNIIVLDRHIKLANIQETYSLLNLTLKSNRWLLQGSVNHTRCESRRRKFAISNDATSNMDVLLILNSSNDFVKSELINGFQKLIASFTNETKATFEIDFESPLITYFKKRMDLNMNTNNSNSSNSSNKSTSSSSYNNSSRRNSELIGRPTKIKFCKSNIIFTTLDSANKTTSPSIQDHQQHHYNHHRHQQCHEPFDNGNKNGPHKFGFIINRIRNAFSNNKNIKTASTSSTNIDRQQYSKFSLDNLPYILCYLDENKNNMKYSAYNDDKFMNLLKSGGHFSPSSNNTTSTSKKSATTKSVMSSGAFDQSAYDNTGLGTSDSNLDDLSTSSSSGSTSSYSCSSGTSSAALSEDDSSTNSTSRSFTYIGQHELKSMMQQIQQQQQQAEINEASKHVNSSLKKFNKPQPIYDVPDYVPSNINLADVQLHSSSSNTSASSTGAKFTKNQQSLSRSSKIFNTARLKISTMTTNKNNTDRNSDNFSSPNSSNKNVEEKKKASNSTTSFYDKTEVGSISAVSSISNYLSRKKKLSQSFERLNSSVLLAVGGGKDRDGLIENEEYRDENGGSSTMIKRVSASIEFKESDFLPKSATTTTVNSTKNKRDGRIILSTSGGGSEKKEERRSSNGNTNKHAKESAEKEVPITRHPALVKNSFKSRSMDLLDTCDALLSRKATKPILKQTNHSALKTSDIDDVDEATKLNTYLNGQVNSNLSSYYKRSSTENSIQRVSTSAAPITAPVAAPIPAQLNPAPLIYLTPINLNEPQPPPLPTTNPPQQQQPHQQRLKKNTSNNLNPRQMSNTSLYSKCVNSKNTPNGGGSVKRASSPPPPVYLSPNGMIAPPPPPPTVAHPHYQQQHSRANINPPEPMYHRPQPLTQKQTQTPSKHHQYLYPVDVTNKNRFVPIGNPYQQQYLPIPPQQPPQQPHPHNKENMSNDYNKKKFNEIREIFENNTSTTSSNSTNNSRSANRGIEQSRAKMQSNSTAMLSANNFNPAPQQIHPQYQYQYCHEFNFPSDFTASSSSAALHNNTLRASGNFPSSQHVPSTSHHRHVNANLHHQMPQQHGLYNHLYHFNNINNTSKKNEQYGLFVNS